MRLVLRKLAPITTAALLVMAIMAAPLCNTLCASPASCQAHMSAAETTSDTCHHATVSAESDDSATALASNAICAQPEIPAIVADTAWTQTDQQLDRISTPLSSPLIAVSSAIQTSAKDAALSDSGGTLTSSAPRLRTTILQI